MKAINSLLFVLFCTCPFVKGQDNVYTSIGEEDTNECTSQYKHCLDDGMVKWSLLDYHEIDAGLVTTELIAFGDTLINGNGYKKIYSVPDSYSKSADNEGWKNYYPDLNDRWLMGCVEYVYIRESADASKLYLYNAQEEEEYLMSDISLQKGDIFLGYGGTCIVDSVYVKNELKHIRLSADDFWGPILFIEGVGPNIWHTSYNCIAGSNGTLNCFQNQTIFYKNDEKKNSGFDFGQCYCGYQDPPYAIHSIEKEDYRLSIQNEKIEMIFLSNAKREIRLYNLYGQLLWEQTSENQSLTIPSSGYGKGVYIIQIANRQSKRIGTEKIIL